MKRIASFLFVLVLLSGLFPAAMGEAAREAVLPDLTDRNFYAFSGTWGGENPADPAEIQPEWGMGYASISLKSEEQQTESGLHVGSYLLTGVTDAGETVEILRLEAAADGSVAYTLGGESWRYDHAAGTYEKAR